MESRKTVVFITHSTSGRFSWRPRHGDAAPRQGRRPVRSRPAAPARSIMTTEKFGGYVRRIRKSLNAGGGLE
jgi:hypothetical protein